MKTAAAELARKAGIQSAFSWSALPCLWSRCITRNAAYSTGGDTREMALTLWKCMIIGLGMKFAGTAACKPTVLWTRRMRRFCDFTVQNIQLPLVQQVMRKTEQSEICNHETERINRNRETAEAGKGSCFLNGSQESPFNLAKYTWQKPDICRARHVVLICRECAEYVLQHFVKHEVNYLLLLNVIIECWLFVK